LKKLFPFQALAIGISILAASYISPMKTTAADGVKPETPQQAFLRGKGCDKGLIINSDDLGRTIWSNEAILKGFREGIVTSTSLMPADLSAKEAYQLVRENPDLDVGVHLTLARDDTPGHEYGPLSPLDQVKHLVDDKGYFFLNISSLSAVPQSEIDAELSAQVKAVYDNGVDVTHLDCHKGFYHTFDKKSLSVTLKLAKKYDLPIRWMGRANDPDLVRNGIIVTDSLTMTNGKEPFDLRKKNMIGNISKIKSGTILEIVLHPATGGYVEDEAQSREADLQLVLDPDVKKTITDNNICLIGYRELRDFQRKWRKQRDAGN